MKLKKVVQQAMKQMKVDTLRKEQIKPIDSILEDKDTFVVAPTGSGKSLIYQLPAVIHEDQLTLVIEPTLSLMHDQVQKLCGKGIQAAYIDSTLSKGKAADIMKRAAKGKITLLYVTPERLQSKSFLSKIQDVTLYMVIVDECHCVLEWGESFRPDYLKIGDFVDSRPTRPILAAMTATVRKNDRQEIGKALHMHKVETHITSIDRPNLILLKEPAETPEEKIRRLDKLIRKHHKQGSMIVYCSTRTFTDAVYNHLNNLFPEAVVRCHSGMNDRTRAKHEREFLNGEKSIMVATSAFGMGVDKGDIDLIVHFNMPFSIGEYYQQSGRAGRDGRTAHSILLYGSQDIDIGRYFADKLEGSARDRMLERLGEMEQFTSSDSCMMQDILAYFGEKKSKTCKHCTNCQRNRRE